MLWDMLMVSCYPVALSDREDYLHIGTSVCVIPPALAVVHRPPPSAFHLLLYLLPVHLASGSPQRG